jgi:heme oxygenase
MKDLAAPATAPETRDLPSRLRHETMDCHRRIEALPVFAQLMAPDVTREALRGHLGRMLGFYEQAERRLAFHGALPGLDLPRRLVKAERLRSDLAALGLLSCDIDALPRWPGRPLEAEDAWGLLYVLEGATLGGQLIARHLVARLGLSGEEELSFFLPYGAAAGAMWRGFRAAAVEAERAGRIDPDAVIPAARMAFDDLGTWAMAGR